ncbi:restriction endonuclease [Streptomyces sp. GbtcB6]|uniref:restriction endonuclease n=1 Tax=Streptomyces sp. GbtcB6 TaxID=2824751 RepID=UPI0027E41DA0|nr:restriction endonuclease [Streptomyces sp. GbtcB6]
MTSTNVQTFNGTARPEHPADVPVMITNGSFSEPAREFARDHAIHLVGSRELERWASGGIRCTRWWVYLRRVPQG